MKKYRIVERTTCYDTYSSTGYVIQEKWLGFWWDHDEVSHSCLEFAESRLAKIIEMRNCKNSQTVVVEKEV